MGDFGLATVLEEKSEKEECNNLNSNISKLNTKKEVKQGTPLYMAPELLKNDKIEYTQAVDIFALGIVLFEIVCKL